MWEEVFFPRNNAVTPNQAIRLALQLGKPVHNDQTAPFGAVLGERRDSAEEGARGENPLIFSGLGQARGAPFTSKDASSKVSDILMLPERWITHWAPLSKSLSAPNLLTSNSPSQPNPSPQASRLQGATEWSLPREQLR